MNAEIYYFSGTGNTLVVARDIAERTGGRLVPIHSVIDNESITPGADVVGIVFPVYYVTFGGLPQMVKRFVGKLRCPERVYVFAGCTYGSGEIIALRSMARALAASGARLSFGFAVNMPENIHPTLGAGRHGKMFDAWKNDADRVARMIRSKKKGRLTLPNVLVGKAYGFLNLIGHALLPAFRGSTLSQMRECARSQAESYDALIPLMDSSFSVTEACNGCGTCGKICPGRNIRMENGRPAWRHECEYCLACFHWCPREAIESSALESRIKYRHPDVKVKDMLREC